MCHKMRQWGRLTWLNRELGLGLRLKRKVRNIWKKGQTTQKDNRDVVRLLYSDKIKRTNAQLEPNQTTAVKDNKNISKNTPSAKGGLRTLSILHWMKVETVKRGEEKAGALNAFFGSVFKSKTNSPKALS